ncbi:glycosyltransferase [Rothia kristinae]|uniref:glycosyltransferase n=1 Tax=Rothia kristinae TaxID=37923 RepID=UPI0033D357DC
MTAPPDAPPPAAQRTVSADERAPGSRGLVLHVLSMHTSPLAQPGDGDAGGMNVYIAHLCAALARAGHRVEVFTLDTSPDAASAPSVRTASPAPGLRVHTLALPAAAGAGKADLARLTGAFGRACAEVAQRLPAPDALHAHYWLSGQAALSLREQLGRTAERLPLVLTLHTTARIKNRHAGAGEPPEPQERAAAEEELLRATQAVIANTDTEARELVQLYGADPRRLHTVPPGVDAAVFHPDPERPTSPAPASQEPGSQTLASPESAPEDAAPSARETSEDPAPFRILFAGRPQPLKGPEILIRALPELIRRVPEARLEIRGSASPQYLTRLRALARDEGVLARCRFTPACPAPQLASAMRAADVVACPSSSETFGLVALEAQACGTPVAASDVGGLRTALEDGRAGLLVPERTPRAWARSLALLAEDPALRARLRARGLAHARTLTWDDAARRTAAVYAAVVGAR